MELYSEIAGEDEWYRIEGKENILTSFYVFFENGEMYELIKEPFTETVVSDNLLVKFISRLDIYPIFIHIVSWSKWINISRFTSPNRISSDLYHHCIQVNDMNDFCKVIRLSYLDSFNGERLMISTDKGISIHNGTDGKIDADTFRYELDFLEFGSFKYYLLFSYDGDGFDYLSNFHYHPYKGLEIIEG